MRKKLRDFGARLLGMSRTFRILQLKEKNLFGPLKLRNLTSFTVAKNDALMETNVAKGMNVLMKQRSQHSVKCRTVIINLD